VITEPGNHGFADFTKLLKKTKLLGKFRLPDKRGFELMEKRRAENLLSRSQPPFIG